MNAAPPLGTIPCHPWSQTPPFIGDRTWSGSGRGYFCIHGFEHNFMTVCPLLFIIYMNDIVNCSSELYFILCADDTNIFYSCRNLCDLMITVNEELNKLSNWFRANKLSLNVKK